MLENEVEGNLNCTISLEGSTNEDDEDRLNENNLCLFENEEDEVYYSLDHNEHSSYDELKDAFEELYDDFKKSSP